MNRRIIHDRISPDRRKSRAMALPLALVALLVAGLLVGVSIYLVENMVSVNRAKIEDELRMNAANSGIEIGKKWVFQRINGPVALRRRTGWGKELSASATIANLEVEKTSRVIDGVDVETVVYDVLFEGVAPGLDLGVNSVPLFGRTSMNNFDHSTGSSPPPVQGAYVIRSRAVYNGIEKILEQGLLVRKDTEL